MYNLITAITNAPCIYPIYLSYAKSDYITTSILSFVSVASIVSHLAENHKHGMPGLFNISTNTSYILNRLDVFGAIMTGMRITYLYYQKFGLNVNVFFKHPYECFFM